MPPPKLEQEADPIFSTNYCLTSRSFPLRNLALFAALFHINKLSGEYCEVRCGEWTHHPSCLPARCKHQLLVPVARNGNQEVLYPQSWLWQPNLAWLQCPHIVPPHLQLLLLACHGARFYRQHSTTSGGEIVNTVLGTPQPLHPLRVLCTSIRA